MKETKIKELLYKNYLKWRSISEWINADKEPTESEVKRYLGYFGINRR